MPVLKNKVTGKTYPASKEQVNEIRINEMTKDLYDISEVETPAEVKQLQEISGSKENLPTEKQASDKTATK